jgi:hypothetical protein
MLGVAVAAIFALSAVVAGPALATGSAARVYEKFAQCPFGAPPVVPGDNSVDEAGCIYGEAGKESFFQAGKFTIYFKNPVILRGGFEQFESSRVFQFVGARDGDTISRKAEPGPSLTEGLDPEKLAEPEKKRYEEYLAAGKSTKTTETIELAEPATDIELGIFELLLEEGTAFGFPVMVHISNPFLGKNCYVGNTIEPINVPFTTGETSPPAPNTPIHGQVGEIKPLAEGNVLRVGTPTKLTELVNNSYAAPGVEGCGIQGGADEAANAGLGLPSPAGTNTSELIGSLYQAGSQSLLEHFKPFVRTR